MKVEDIIDNLENFDNGLLDDIVEQIENVKKCRQENECYEIVIKLNDLLEPIIEILKELQGKNMIGDCDFLIGNEFVAINDEDGNFINLKY